VIAPPELRSREHLKSFVDSEIKFWEQIIKASGVSWIENHE